MFPLIPGASLIYLCLYCYDFSMQSKGVIPRLLIDAEALHYHSNRQLCSVVPNAMISCHACIHAKQSVALAKIEWLGKVDHCMCYLLFCFSPYP